MPNWCENRVSVAGDADLVKEFIELVRGEGEEGAFSFQAIDPMPDELLETTAPSEDGLNWYFWRVNNWGCKWDVGETDYYDAEPDYGYVHYEFMTAWGPPNGIYDTLCEKFPNLDIIWFYHEPGCQLAGYLNND